MNSKKEEEFSPSELESLANSLQAWITKAETAIQSVNEDLLSSDEQTRVAQEHEKAIKEESEKLVKSLGTASSDPNQPSSSGLKAADAMERMMAGKSDAKRHRGPLRMKRSGN